MSGFRSGVWLLTALVLAVQVWTLVVKLSPHHAVGILRSGPTVVAVRPGLPAARAGLRPGDRFEPDEQTMSLMRDMTLANLHGIYHIHVRRGNTNLALTITPNDVPGWRFVSPNELADDIATFVVFAIWVLIAAWLFSQRPGMLTLTFYLAAFPFGIADQFFVAQFPAAARHSMDALLSALFGSAGRFMLVVFALRFPDDRVTGKRKVAQGIAFAFAAVAFIDDASAELTASLGVSWLQYALESLTSWTGVASLAAAAAVFITRFADTVGLSRAKLRWALVGISVPLLASVFLGALLTLRPQTSVIITPVVTLSYLSLPPIVAYVLTRTRFIDPRFTVNRATAISFTGVALVALVAVADWVTSKLISQRFATETIDAAFAIAVAFALHSAHKRVERTIERLLFARKHRAERRLREIGAALRFATSDSVIADALVIQVSSEMQLSAAALFRYNPLNSFYERVESTGWSETDVRQLPENEQIVRLVKAKRDALNLREWHLQGPCVPREDAEPRLAIPLLQRDSISALVLYSGHRDHTDLDGTEIALLVDLAERSSSALDHIEALELRRALSQAQGNHVSMPLLFAKE